MKESIFISDFDNTVSRKDFYWLIIDNYIGQEGREFYQKWKKENKIDLPFVEKIFAWHQFTQAEHDALLDQIEIDSYMKDFQALCKKQKIPFMLLSAGMSYYINWLLEKERLDVPVITNKGDFQNGYFTIEREEGTWYDHPLYGIDKGKVVKHYKKKYRKVFFAGDSEPDYTAAIEADVCFAKEELAVLLKKKGHPFHPFNNFKEIAAYLI